MSKTVMLFDGFDANSNEGLWVSDGTAAGTTEIPVSGVGPVGGLSPSDITPYEGKALFAGYDASGPATDNLWVTDGTSAGTHEIQVAGVASSGLFPHEMKVYDGKVLFNGSDASGNEDLWVTDGTAAGTKEIPVAGAPAGGLAPSDFTAYNGKLLFDGATSGDGPSLWVTDGTSAGTKEIPVSGAGPVGLDPIDMTVYNGKVLFAGYDVLTHSGHHTGVDQGTQLWVTDGTSAGTKEIKVAGAYSGGLHPSDFTAYDGKLLFTGEDSQGRYNLWTTDGTSAGTKEILGAGGTPAFSGVYITQLTPLGGKVLFAGTDAQDKSNLWITDGTAAGTHEIPVAGVNSVLGLSPLSMTAYDGKVFFDGRDAQNVVNLWETDGTAAGTKEVPVSGQNAAGLSPSDLTVATLDPDPPPMIVDNGHGDTITITQANTIVTLGGTDQNIFLAAPGASVSDGAQGLSLHLGSDPGQVTLSGFGSDAHGVVDLLSGFGGFTSAGQVAAALHDDQHGGTLLSFGAAGSLDVVGVAPGALHAANFAIVPSG